MNGILEEMLMRAVRSVLTADAVKGFEEQVVAFLYELAKKQDNKLELDMVKAVADALQVSVPAE